jgi:hypothetical protein
MLQATKRHDSALGQCHPRKRHNPGLSQMTKTCQAFVSLPAIGGRDERLVSLSVWATVFHLESGTRRRRLRRSISSRRPEHAFDWEKMPHYSHGNGVLWLLQDTIKSLARMCDAFRQKYDSWSTWSHIALHRGLALWCLLCIRLRRDSVTKQANTPALARDASFCIPTASIFCHMVSRTVHFS